MVVTPVKEIRPGNDILDTDDLNPSGSRIADSSPTHDLPPHFGYQKLSSGEYLALRVPFAQYTLNFKFIRATSVRGRSLTDRSAGTSHFMDP